MPGTKSTVSAAADDEDDNDEDHDDDDDVGPSVDGPVSSASSTSSSSVFEGVVAVPTDNVSAHPEARRNPRRLAATTGDWFGSMALGDRSCEFHHHRHHRRQWFPGNRGRDIPWEPRICDFSETGFAQTSS
jgi:hypothetical protein